VNATTELEVEREQRGINTHEGLKKHKGFKGIEARKA
jgi:hypothetical protein